MITDKDYHALADDVYKVDAKKIKQPFKKGTTVGNDQYKIISVEDNHSNGMQAMAVAPFMNKEIFCFDKRIFISVFFC